MGFEVGDTQKLEAQYETLSSKLTTLRKKQADLNKTDLSQVTKSIDKIGESASGVIKKIGRWVSAVFAVRSAYSAVRQAMSTLQQYDAGIKANITYIQFAIANALKSLIEGLIQLAFKLLTYVGYIAKAWFGVNIFAGATTDAFKNANKQAEKLKKTTAGFDELNVVSGGASASASTGGTPSFDLSTPKDVPIPSWIKWIADNKEVVLTVLAGIAGGLTAVWLGLTLIQGLGIGLMIFGVIELIGDLNEYIGLLDGSLENNGTSWEDFGKIVTDVGLIILGIGILTGNLPLIIAGAITTIVGLVLQNWTKIQGIISSAWVWLDGKLKWIEKTFGLLGEFITNPIRIAIKTVSSIFEGLFKTIKRIFDGLLLIFKGDFKNGFISIAKGIANAFITVINTMINGLNMAISPFRALIVAFGKVTGKGWKMDNIKIPTIKYMKTGGIINYPNRGIPVGGAIGGESGAEGVLPLTDSQAMATLGEYIGKYVNIENVINNYMDSRKISRIMASSNNRSSLASNG